MKKSSVEVTVGIFVLIGILCVGYLAIRLGQMNVFGRSDQYVLEARFTNIGGLIEGATVSMAGVQVGQIAAIRIDPEEKVAIVHLRIKKELILTDEAIASIKTSGLIGDKYVNLSPGGGLENLKNGDRIWETESAVDLEELIAKYVFGNI